MMDLAVVKNHLKVEHDFDDELIKVIYVPMAENEIKGAVTQDAASDFFNKSPTYNGAVLLLTAHYYENRGATSMRDMKEIPFGILTLIQRLRSDFEKWKSESSTLG
ncbi:phage gp6-like head-tail connector protein [Listeria booriae]|uniref:head-tail connector protein n=1 Tax=Listeria booriae TaxID=1552123 RepID=UPI00162AA784|nr:head-tail connector protein [Listeria booriae]MBC1524120.1 phage gp6-like head-tail connector protein [Listeria booriae]MBC6133919.1 phage gp6-like head-tail connector protein [Listeria booriae]